MGDTKSTNSLIKHPVNIDLFLSSDDTRRYPRCFVHTASYPDSHYWIGVLLCLHQSNGLIFPVFFTSHFHLRVVIMKRMSQTPQFL